MTLASIPRAIWAVIGLAVLVLGALIFLRLHDARVRDTAEAVRIETSLDSVVNVLAKDTAQLHARIRTLDSLYATAKATVVRVAYVPQSLRDSIATLTHEIALAAARGDSTVPIVVAHQAAEQLLACRAQVDTLAGAAGALGAACEQRVAARDSTIRDDALLLRAKDSTIAVLKHGPGLSTPRLSPYVAARFSVRRHAWEEEVGAKVRLFSGLHWESAVRMRDSLDVVTGLRYEFK